MTWKHHRARRVVGTVAGRAGLVLVVACGAGACAASTRVTSIESTAPPTVGSLGPAGTGSSDPTRTSITRASSAPPTVGSLDTAGTGSSDPTPSAPQAPTPSPTQAPPPASSGPATSALPSPPPPLLAELGTDPHALARQIGDAVRTILDDASPPDAVEAAGQREQLVIRRLAAHQDWQPTVLADLANDDVVHAVVDNDLAAVNAPGNVALAKPVPPRDTMPAWRIRAPRAADELIGYYKEAEAATGVEWVYLAAINLVETRMGRIEGLSTAGAVGPMQFLPSTWSVCCKGDPRDDHDAIRGAAAYLARRGAPADMRTAILGYNPNDAYLEMISRYADNLRAHPRLYLGYHAWQVFVSTTAGPVRLPVGYEMTDPEPADTWVADHPDARA